MSLAETELQITLRKDSEFTVKDSTLIPVPELAFADTIYSSEGEISVSASATDETVSIGDLGTVKFLLLQVDAANAGSLTFKINGNSSSETANPLVVYSGALSGLTASNSTASEIKVRWRAIYG